MKTPQYTCALSLVATLGLLAGCAGSNQVPFAEAGPMADTVPADVLGWSADLLPTGDAATNTELLLSYEYGEGSQASLLLVLADGTVAHLEREQGIESNLGAAALEQTALAELKRLIAEAGAGFVATADSLGGMDEGYLVVTTAAGVEVVIRRINRSTNPGALQPSRFEYNTASAATRIHDLVDDYVAMKMPREAVLAP